MKYFKDFEDFKEFDNLETLRIEEQLKHEGFTPYANWKTTENSNRAPASQPASQNHPQPPTPPQKSKPTNTTGQPDLPQQRYHPLGGCFEQYLTTPSTEEQTNQHKKGKPIHRSQAPTPIFMHFQPLGSCLGKS